MNCQLKLAACKVPGRRNGRSRPVGSLIAKPAWFSCVWPHDGDPAPSTDVQGRDGV
ncbi:MAG: hypothetical protein QOJ93_2022, partial [Actinomycetota bacterium]|nr:hypothetical protein [Actinomycetota bacterium]